MAQVIVEAISTGASIYNFNAGDAPVLRIYALKSFITSDGHVIHQGSPNRPRSWYLEVQCSVTGGNILLVPSFQIDSTTDSPTYPNQPYAAQYSATLFTSANGNGRSCGVFPGEFLTQFSVPTGDGDDSVLTWDFLNQFNNSYPLQYASLMFPTNQQVLQMIEDLAGDRDFSSETRTGITALTTDPFDPSFPIAVSATDPLWLQIIAGGGGIGFFFLSNYTDLADAVATIGSTRATLLIDTVADVADDLTIPETMTLFFTNAGGIQPATGKTVTILGPITAPPFKIFYNALSGEGTIDFTDNRSIAAYYPQWFGVAGTFDVDDAPALNAFFAALPNDSQGVFTNDLLMNIQSTVSMLSKKGVKLTATGYGMADSVGPIMIWQGVDGGTMLVLGKCYRCDFEGITLWGSVTQDTVGADIGIHLDNDTGPSGISSQNVFRNVSVYGNSLRNTWIGVNIGDGTGANNEFHIFDNCFFRASSSDSVNLAAGAGGVTGLNIKIVHGNVKGIQFNNCILSNADVGLRCNNGSFTAYGFKSGLLRTAYQINNATDDITIQFDQYEEVVQVINGSGMTNPLRIIGGRYDHSGVSSTLIATVANPYLDLSSFTNVEITGNYFGDFFNYATATTLVKPSSQGRILWLNNNFDNLTPAILDTNLAVARQCLSDGQGAVTGFGGWLLGGNTFYQNSLYGQLSFPTRRGIIGVQQDTDNSGNAGGVMGTQNMVVIDSGVLESNSLAIPNYPKVTVVGTTGATPYTIAILARDALGNRTLRSILNQSTSTANATLTGSNYLQIDWAAVPGATDYLVLQFSGGFRVIATVVASGTAAETTNITANPAGAFTYTMPTYNETAKKITRARDVFPNELTFTADDATPSVAGGVTDFLTANANPTSITTFDDGTTGQIIRVRVNDANTTIVNASGILTQTGANITATNGFVYSFIRRGSNWVQL